MARMSIDDKVCRDPRIAMLAVAVGWSRRETVGCLVLDVWALCYDQETPLVSERLIDASAGLPGFAQSMIDCDLATRDRGGKVRVRGAKDRIKYLEKKRDAGREGGLKSAEVRAQGVKHPAKHTSSTGQAPGNPIAIAIATVPDSPNLTPDLQLARRLVGSIVRNVPNGTLSKASESDREKRAVAWADDVRLMRERDGHALDEITKLVEWSQRHSFWRAQILSMGNLRDKWDQLQAQCDRERTQPGQQQTIKPVHSDADDDEAVHPLFAAIAASRAGAE